MAEQIGWVMAFYVSKSFGIRLKVSIAYLAYCFKERLSENFLRILDPVGSSNLPYNITALKKV